MPRSSLLEKVMTDPIRKDQKFASYEEFKRTFFPNAFQQEEVQVNHEITEEQAQRLRQVMIDWSQNFFSEEL